MNRAATSVRRNSLRSLRAEYSRNLSLMMFISSCSSINPSPVYPPESPGTRGEEEKPRRGSRRSFPGSLQGRLDILYIFIVRTPFLNTTIIVHYHKFLYKSFLFTVYCARSWGQPLAATGETAAPSRPLIMIDTSHLRGLRRLSPCCRTRVGHCYPARFDFDALICLSCRAPVYEHELWNNRGERVWPVDATNFPPSPPFRKSRRVPQDPEPAGYPLHLHPSLLRNIK